MDAFDFAVEHRRQLDQHCLQVPLNENRRSNCTHRRDRFE
jgi:hypothetical protein